MWQQQVSSLTICPTICPTPYNRKLNVSSASLNKTFPFRSFPKIQHPLINKSMRSGGVIKTNFGSFVKFN